MGVVALSWHIAWNYVNMVSCKLQLYSVPQKMEIIFHEMFSKDTQYPILLRLWLSSLLNFVNICFSKWHSRFFHLSIQIEPLVTMKCMKNTSFGSYDLECSGIFIFPLSLIRDGGKRACVLKEWIYCLGKCKSLFPLWPSISLDKCVHCFLKQTNRNSSNYHLTVRSGFHGGMQHQPRFKESTNTISKESLC